MVRFTIAQIAKRDGKRGYPREEDGIEISLWEPVPEPSTTAPISPDLSVGARDLAGPAANDLHDKKLEK